MAIQISGVSMGVITGGPSSITLQDLANVSIVSPLTGQYLRYNAGISEWQNAYLTTDVYDYLDSSLSGTQGVTTTFVSGPNTIAIGLGAITPTSVAASGTVTGSNLSGTNTGDQTITLTGDATGSGTGSFTTTLATVNASPQTDQFRKITVNAKGLVTATSAVTSGDITTALGYTPVNRAGDTMTGALILNADPSTAFGAATKQYVDNVASGIISKPAALAATTANLTSTYNNGASGVGATLTSTANGAWPGVDGVTSGWVVGEGVLVKDQTAPAQNGRYNLTTIGDGSTPWVLTRCTLCDTASEIPGSYVFIQDGTQAGTGWVAIVTDPLTFVVGTDAILWTQFSGAGTLVAGTGIDISSNIVSNTGVLSAIAGTNITVSSATGNVTIGLPTTLTGLTSVTSTGFTGALTGTATNAVNVAITDDTTTNANEFIVWSADSTGNNGLRVTSTKLLFNPSTGVLSSTAFNATSTARVKSAIVDLGTSYLNRFSMLKPREYDRKDYRAHEFGFIAEEMNEVYPEVVGKDNDGKPSGIDYGKLATILTAKVQEQQTVIDTLKVQMAQVMEMLKGVK